MEPEKSYNPIANEENQYPINKSQEWVLSQMYYGMRRLEQDFKNFEHKLDRQVSHETVKNIKDDINDMHDVQSIHELRIRTLEDWKIKMYAIAFFSSIVIGLIIHILELFLKGK